VTSYEGGDSMRVLLIEDDRATAQGIELMLKSEGFNTYVTDLGEEGVDLGKLYDYDIILLDLNLPDMPGFDVLKPCAWPRSIRRS
jgi:two-component system cell cycle response regulator CtrA